MDQASTTPTTTTSKESETVKEREEKLAQEFLTVLDSSVEECNSEVKLVLQTQKDLQIALHRLGGEVQKIFQRLPRADITNKTNKISSMKRRVGRLNYSLGQIQVRGFCFCFLGG